MARYESRYTGEEIDSLQNQITQLKSIGRYLSLWNAYDGKAVTIPSGYKTGDEYSYQTGDYFRVSIDGNRVPTGSTYKVGGTNYETITTQVHNGDIYYFDGAQWTLQIGTFDYTKLDKLITTGNFLYSHDGENQGEIPVSNFIGVNGGTMKDNLNFNDSSSFIGFDTNTLKFGISTEHPFVINCDTLSVVSSDEIIFDTSNITFGDSETATVVVAPIIANQSGITAAAKLGTMEHPWSSLHLAKWDGSLNSGGIINFGDGDNDDSSNCYIGELNDDILTIYGSEGINLFTGSAEEPITLRTNNSGHNVCLHTPSDLSTSIHVYFPSKDGTIALAEYDSDTETLNIKQ